MLKSVLIVCFMTLVYSTYGCDRDRGKTEDMKGERIVPVEVIKVKTGRMTSYISATGNIYSLQEANVGPRISGRIEKILADEGDYVQKGQILIRLEQKQLNIAKQQADAALATARASLKRLLAGTREEEIRLAEAGLNKAEANLRNAEREFKRFKKLLAEHTIEKKAYDASETNYKIATAQYGEAREKLEMAREGPTKEDIGVARAKVKQADVGVEMANQRLEDSITLAPFAGFIISKLKNEGEYVTATPATTVLKIVDISWVKVEAGIPENEMGRVKKENQAEVRVDSYPERLFRGEVSVVNPSVDPRSRTFKIKVEIPNRERLLKDGMFARVKIAVEEHEGVHIIPEDAIIEANNYRFVFVLNENTAHRRKITTGIVEGGQIEVTSGLKQGEVVVIAGQYDLKDGSPVNIIKKGDES
ncbi:MAG: efflux RND transporter periplasmic adaptor subunit [Thermodesulfobacteriota bacterium]|nr:efflux RND transporter periplasmic adaptor subunit [Thermodesulfobacteriota bacterium]